MSLLEIENLSLEIGGYPILRNVDLAIDAGEVMGLVGESGSGKSMTALSVMRLLPPAFRASGRIGLDGIDILDLSEQQMCSLRGDDIGMVFQEPMTALNPLKTIGEQVAEGIRWHTRANRMDAEAQARRMLDRVGLPAGKFPLTRYPHELSGGQRQRVVIAIACALKPKLLIADEPTTALDVVLQAQILELLRDLVEDNRMGLLLISHDLAVVTEMADRITILRGGEVMEAGDTAETLSAQAHPYTRQLAQASMHVPERRKRHPFYPLEEEMSPTTTEGGISGGAVSTLSADLLPPEAQGVPLLSVGNISKDYPSRRTSFFHKPPPIRAVDNVSFSIGEGHSVALVGRSGCGKSTLARMILALDEPTSGTIAFRGETITGRDQASLRSARRDMQVVFQDP
ncbi:MAG: ATP-binding cassette domain-containing protein, partial [Pseudomonadota bacterium]|nr:ATP-binding cassette domain-containing protein [Pseudomonadota bacterium]